MRIIILCAVAALLAACVYLKDPKESQVIVYTNTCLLGLCESADEISRVGDPRAGGDVTETIDEDKTVSQKADGTLSVPMTGGGLPPIPAAGGGLDQVIDEVQNTQSETETQEKTETGAAEGQPAAEGGNGP